MSFNDTQSSKYLITNEDTVSSADLMTLLIKNLRKAELHLRKLDNEVSVLSRKLALKDNEINILKKQLSAVKRSSRKEQIKYYKKMQEEYQKERDTLQDSVAYYEDICGYDTEESTCSNNPVEFDKLLSCLKELNDLVLSESPSICSTVSGARFKFPESISLTLYADGIIVRSGPFRPYTDPEVCQFLHDILDGYFPSELQSEYPDGVRFQAKDKRNVIYMSNHNYYVRRSFEGQKLGSLPKLWPQKEINNIALQNKYKTHIKEDNKIHGKELTAKKNERMINVKPSYYKISNRSSSDIMKNLPKTANMSSPRVTSRNKVYVEESKRQMSVDRFLKRLPVAKINKNGELLPIKSEILEMLTVMPEPVTAVKIPDSESCEKGQEKIFLKIRSEDGSTVYTLGVSPSNTVKSVRDILDKSRTTNMNHDYIILFHYKPGSCRILSNMSQTLHEYGITCNTVLTLRYNEQI